MELRNQGRDKGLSLDAVWAESPHTLNEVGSTFSIQGFDLNYVGVIIGRRLPIAKGKSFLTKRQVVINVQ